MSTVPKRFLLATWEGGGVLPPELGLARRLIARGHEVHVIACSAAERAARASGCSFSPWRTAPNKKSLAPEDDLLRDWEFKNPLAMFKHALEVFFAEPQERFAADVAEVVDQVRPDAILADFAIAGAIIVAEARRIPNALLMPNIYLAPAPGIPPIGPGWQPARGPLGRLRDAIMRGLSNRLWRRAAPAINRARASMGLGPIDTIWAQHDRADQVLVLTSQAFDFAADRLPANVRYVGPLLDDPTWAGDRWSSPWPEDRSEPLVLVGLSSTYQNQKAALANVIAALATLPVRALVTLGPSLEPGSVVSPSPNVVVVPTAPHGLIVPKASAVVTHCGHGTTMRALAAGVPLVCMPMGRDQNDTAARVVARGAGVRLAPTASPAAIRKAVRRVLDEPRWREGARRLAEAIAAETAAIDLPAELERLASQSIAPGSSFQGVAPAAPSAKRVSTNSSKASRRESSPA